MNNPFEVLDARLSNIENLILAMNHTSQSSETDFFCSGSKANSNSDSQNDLITRKEALKLLDISPSTLWRKEKRGDVKVYAFGGKRYYKRSELLESLTPINH